MIIGFVSCCSFVICGAMSFNFQRNLTEVVIKHKKLSFHQAEALLLWWLLLRLADGGGAIAFRKTHPGFFPRAAQCPHKVRTRPTVARSPPDWIQRRPEGPRIIIEFSRFAWFSQASWGAGQLSLLLEHCSSLQQQTSSLQGDSIYHRNNFLYDWSNFLYYGSTLLHYYRIFFSTASWIEMWWFAKSVFPAFVKRLQLAWASAPKLCRCCFCFAGCGVEHFLFTNLPFVQT